MICKECLEEATTPYDKPVFCREHWLLSIEFSERMEYMSKSGGELSLWKQTHKKQSKGVEG